MRLAVWRSDPLNVTHLKILEASFKANGGDYKQLLVDARTQAEAEISAQK